MSTLIVIILISLVVGQSWQDYGRTQLCKIYLKIDLSILKLRQGKLPIYQSKSSGTDKLTDKFIIILYNKQEPCSCFIHKYLTLSKKGLMASLTS